MLVFRPLVARVQIVFLFSLIVCAGIVARHVQVSAAPPARIAAPAKKPAAEPIAARSKPFDAEKLTRAFRGKREDARLKLLDEIERFHMSDAALPDALWRVIEPASKLPNASDSLLYALRLYSRVDDPNSGSRLISLLAAADLRVVLAAIDLLAEHRPAESLAPLAELQQHPAYDKSYALRHAVVSAVARFNEPASVDFLVSTVAASDGQLKYVAAVELARLTGQNFGGKSGEWRKWWQAQRDGFRVVADSSAKTPAGLLAWDYAVPQFYGTPVYAKRVVFVIDRSKSMFSSVEGVTRLDDAAKQLEAAVRGLPDDAWFEIIAYNDTNLPFAGRLTQATPQAKSAAVRFTYAQTADGKTDTFDALADALRVDQNVEAILFLSDGDPNVGTIVDRPAIVAMITGQNKSLRAAINTIGIDARGISEEFLKQLAADNFGTYRSIR
jgi:hypothetical protein